MLDQKVAIVTGSSAGIGAEIAREFAKQGAKVVINYQSEGSTEKAEALVEEIKAMGQEAVAMRLDISQESQAKELVDKTKEIFGRIDILVNNAGITKDGLLMRMKEEQFDDVIRVNLKGAFNCMKYVSLAMLKTGGSIINMSSVSGVMGNAGQCNYAASKAGLIGLTKSAAKELAGRNIRVNAIAPGFITTKMTENLPEAVKEKVKESTPLKRYGTTKEVADVAVFLASNMSSYITGQVIKVDGGMSM